MSYSQTSRKRSSGRNAKEKVKKWTDIKSEKEQKGRFCRASWSLKLSLDEELNSLLKIAH